MKSLRLWSLIVSLATMLGCPETPLSSDVVGNLPDVGDGSGSETEAADSRETTDPGTDTDIETDTSPPRLQFVAVTFNTGTGPEPAHDSGPDDGYTQAMADLTDQWYGNGLNFPPLIEETREFLAGVDPEVVTFQELFWPGECKNIPSDAHAGLICETWEPGDLMVAEMLLVAGFQVACHPGKPDKSAAVHPRFGTFASCDSGFCLEGLEGFPIADCGGGARVARGIINLVTGGTLTLLNVHGSSGADDEDMACRVKQVDRVFVDFGDGAPGVNGARNLVMGDLNTDPGRFFDLDVSAARWLDFVGVDKAFQWITEVGEDAPATYAGLVNIDHVMSDTLQGSCWHPTVTEDHPAFTQTRFFDHLPAVCSLSE